jgi:hypothetical protein
MDKLNLPSYNYRIEEKEGMTKIFDEIRKKLVKLTPEEWVRQHFIQFLITARSYPKGLLLIEKELKVDTLKRRPDLVVYNREGKPIMIVEFKATNIPISEDVFFQIALYNKKLQVPYLILSNGLDHFCAKINQDIGSLEFLENIPDYNDL